MANEISGPLLVVPTQDVFSQAIAPPSEQNSSPKQSNYSAADRLEDSAEHSKSDSCAAYNRSIFGKNYIAAGYSFIQGFLASDLTFRSRHMFTFVNHWHMSCAVAVKDSISNKNSGKEQRTGKRLQPKF